ncbi:MAG: TIGR04211 family SH3 domain-containing protein [Myxococcota bacterium]
MLDSNGSSGLAGAKRAVRSRVALAELAALVALFALVSGPAPAAERGWIRGDVKLNLRSGGGMEYRILGTVETGDPVQVLTRGENWTRIETPDGKVGWIPGGYVDAEPPPVARLASAEARVASLESELERLRSETNELRDSNTALKGNDDEQNRELAALKEENYQLRGISRYQEWLTGGGLLGGGMLAGAWLQRRSANRRPGSRIRL